MIEQVERTTCPNCGYMTPIRPRKKTKRGWRCARCLKYGTPYTVLINVDVK